MFVDGSLAAFQELRIDDPTLFHGHQTDGAIFELERKLARGAGWHVINFTGRQICDIRTAATEAMAFLRLLPAEIEMKTELLPAVGEVDLDPIGASHTKAQLFRVLRSPGRSQPRDRC